MIAFQIPRISACVEISITLLGFQNAASRGPTAMLAMLAFGCSYDHHLPCLPKYVLGILLTPQVVCLC